MSTETAPEVEATATDAPTEEVETEATEPTETDDLGDAGKKALKAERDARKKAEADAKTAREELARTKAEAEGREAEHKAEVEAQRVRDEALAKANGRIVSAELRAAATGQLADPTDALAFIDITDFEVTDDGEVDADAITAAIAELIERKPHLVARGDDGKTPLPDPSQGSANGGKTTTADLFGAAFKDRT